MDTSTMNKITFTGVDDFTALSHIRLSKDSDRALVLAEVEIHCIKEAARFVADELENPVVLNDSMFQTNVTIFFPGK